MTRQGAPPRAGRSLGERIGAARAPRPGGRAAARFPTHGTAALRPNRTPAPATRLRVAPPPPVAVPRTPFIVLVLVIVIGGVLGILLLNTKINENAFRLDDLHRRQVAQSQRQQELERALAIRESSGDLEAQARKLGLVPADQPAYLRMPDGRVFGVPQPADGTPSVTSRGTAGG